MIVEVEGLDKRLEFPDGTDLAVIQKTVKKLIAEKTEGDKKDYSLKEDLSTPLRQFGRIADIYKEEVKSGEAAMDKAVSEPTGKSLFGGLFGALQYGFAPITALARGVAGEPVESTLDVMGAPKGVSKFAGDMAETAANFIPYGGLVREAIVGKKAVEEALALKNAAKGVTLPKTTNKPLEFPEGLPKSAIDDATAPISEANQKILKPQVVDDVAERLKEPAGLFWNPSEKRITQELVDYMTNNPAEIEDIASKYRLSPDQLAAQLKETMTLAGKDLGRMGRLARDIRKKFQTPYMKALSDSIERELPEVQTLDKFGNAFRSVENIRRAALVSQFVTTFRNIVSQGGRFSIGAVDDAFQGAANGYLKSAGEGTLSSIKSTVRGLGEGLDLATAAINRLRPKERAKLLEIINSENAVAAKSKLFSAPVNDVFLTSKLSKVLGYLNKTQEYFFRNIALEAKLRQLARRAGLDLNVIKASDIPENMLKEAAEYALEMTFAAMPKSNFGQSWVKAMSHPIMTAFVNPFPRFLYGNALPFLKNFSPLGFLDAVKPSVVADIVSGNTEKFTKAITQATMGTIMLNTASYIRNSEYAGEKWYQIKAGDKQYDVRAFAPFSTYLFLAESMEKPDRIKPGDWGAAVLSLNRVGGTGLVLSDMLRGRDVATVIDPLKRMAGAWMSGFTVPVRTVKDIYSAVDEEEAVYRDIRGDEFWGPTKQNIPVLSQTMPKARKPTRVGDIKSESPLFRQFTGLSYQVKNRLEKEVDQIQLDYRAIYPQTGDAEGDRRVSEIMAPFLENAYRALEERTNYKQLDELTRRIVLGQLFNDAKRLAQKQLVREDPKLALKIKIKDIPKNVQELLKKKNLLPEIK